MSSAIFSPSLALPLILALAAGQIRLCAQGGPPMITDDPGTPGNGHWEINLGWTYQRTPGSAEFGLPLLDANYGVGERLELNYQTSWAALRTSAGSTSDGPSDSELAVKWRFYDGGEKGWQVSTYPRVTFLDPDSHADRRGLADPDTTCILPFEVTRDFGVVEFNVDFGRIFSAASRERGWMGGLCVGRELRKGLEVMAEVHASTSDDANRAEITVNFGSRIDLSEHATVLLAVGRDAGNSLGPRVSLLSYVGIQIRL